LCSFRCLSFAFRVLLRGAAAVTRLNGSKQGSQTQQSAALGRTQRRKEIREGEENSTNL